MSKSSSVTQWKLFNSWSKHQLSNELQRAQGLSLNHPFEEPEASTASKTSAYLHVCSEAVIGCELPGPPLAHGAFQAAWSRIEAYKFSDPIQVEAHYDDDSPLENRCMLLEIKAFGIKFLGSVRITRVDQYENESSSRNGYRYDTLDGHPENGSEWFILEKDHTSGEIKFKIASAVRPGRYPNWWLQFGYRLIGKFYRDRWHIQSYRRLQAFLGTRTDFPVTLSNSNCTIGFNAQPGTGVKIGKP